MKGLFFDRGQVAYREDLAEPESRDGESRVAVLRAGLCATDVALSRGYLDFCGVPGHEFVGRALDGPLAGRRVVGEINAGCGRCDPCRQGDARHCPDRTVLGIVGRSGAFAERLSLPTVNLHEVPDSVSSDAAVFVEPLAAALAIAEQVELRAGQCALVAGDGRLGILCAHALSLAGLEVEVAGHHAERRRLLPPGVRHRGDLLAGPARRRFDLAVEATGSPGTLALVLRWLRPRGTMVLKTTSERPTSLDLAPLVIDEIRVVGSRCGRFEPALGALAEGRVPVESLIEGRHSLPDGVAALERVSAGSVLKLLLEPAAPG